MSSIIKVKAVSKLYGFGDATTVALDEVSLNVQRGEFISIMGPSGCGKSTLMQIIGLLDKPTHGQYILNGRTVSSIRNRQAVKLRRDSLGFIFQSFNLLPRLTAIENVALPLAYQGVSQTKRLKIASELLERVGLREREYYLPSQLGGGQVQRVAIARALINKPSILIADEPTGNLDTASSRLVMELLSEIHRQGNTILMVTHNPELTRYANRAIYMRDGEIIHDEKTRIGYIAKTARKITVPNTKKTEEDDLAGVSELIKAIPKSSDNKTAKKRPKRLVRHKVSSRLKPRAKLKKKRAVK